MNPMRVSLSDCQGAPSSVQQDVAGSHPSHHCPEELASDADELAVELHECIVWSSGISFSHQLPDVYISTAGIR